MRYLAFDVGGTAIKHALIDEDFQLSDKGSFPSAAVASSAEFIEALGSVRDRYAEQISGVAVSTCGELDPSSGELFSGGSLRFNTGTNLVNLLQDRCGLRVSVENDANCALLAELHDGSLAQATNAFVVVLGTAVGGAVMINRHLYRGSHFHAGNASLVATSLDAPSDRAGLMAGRGGVVGLTGPLARRKGWDPAGVDGRTVFDLVAAGDPDALEVLDSYCSLLAAFIYNAQVLLDVDVVAVGGGISARSELVQNLAGKVDEVFDAAIIDLPRPAVRTCRYRSDANLVGALYLHLHPDA